MKIAVAQIDCRLGDVDANVAHIRKPSETPENAVFRPDRISGRHTPRLQHKRLEISAGHLEQPLDFARVLWTATQSFCSGSTVGSFARHSATWAS